jgi:hypothetical protein
MRRFVIAMVGLVLLGGCGGTATTQIDLAAVETAIYQAGDLSGVVAGTAQRQLPAGLAADVPTTPEREGVVFRLLNKGAQPAGNVAAVIYSSAADATTAYGALKHAWPAAADIGESAAMAPADALGMARLVFVRCRAVISVTLQSEAAPARSYAKVIDGRIQPIACK